MFTAHCIGLKFFCAVRGVLESFYTVFFLTRPGTCIPYSYSLQNYKTHQSCRLFKRLAIGSRIASIPGHRSKSRGLLVPAARRLAGKGRRLTRGGAKRREGGDYWSLDSDVWAVLPPNAFNNDQ